MEEALTTLLLGDGVLAALVDGRIAWGIHPPGETARPYVNVSFVSGLHGYTIEGPSDYAARVQLDAWADTAAQALAVRRALVEALSGYSGAPLPGVQFGIVRVIAERSMDGRSAAGGGPRFGASIDIQFRITGGG